MAKRFSKYSGKKKKNHVFAGWARWETQRNGLVDLARRCQDTSREIQMLNKRQEIFQNAVDGRLRVQDRASERMQDPRNTELVPAGRLAPNKTARWRRAHQTLVHTKTGETLQLSEKEHDLWMYQNEKEEAKRLQGARKPRKDEPDWEEAKRMEEREWRLVPEGETEVPEIIIVSDVVESTFVDLDGESRRELVEAKLSGRERSTKRRV